MSRLRLLLLLCFATPALASHVAFVDNTRPLASGNGSASEPFNSIAQAAGSHAEVIYVMETAQEYVETITLQKGQMLIGSAYGLDALRVDMKVEVDASAPALQGPGPQIHGAINVMGDNVIAGCTIIPPRGGTGVVGSGAQGMLTLRNVRFRPSQRSFAIFLQEQHGDVTIDGGAIDATEEGSGIGITGGDGNVTVERFPMNGSFGSIVQINNRERGMVRFRNGSRIHADDAGDDAIVIANVSGTAGVAFEDRMLIHGRRRGFVATRVAKLSVASGGSTIETTNGAALELRDSGAEVAFDSLSASGATLGEGVIIDRVHGHVTVAGTNGQPGSGGTIRGAQRYAMRIAQTDHVRFANMTLAASGSNKPIKGARCAGEFDVNTTAPCNAALYLRHVTDASFENIVIDSGGAMGINGNNIRDIKFDAVEVRHAGDESFEAGVLLQEIGGTVSFTRSSFTDNAGSEVMTEQRFNSGHVIFERCTFAAPERPTLATRLVDVHTNGHAQIDVAIRNSELHDNAGAAIAANASDGSTLSLTIETSDLARLGATPITGGAQATGRFVFALRQSQIAAPSAQGSVDIHAAGNGSACVAMSGNRLISSGPAIRLAAVPGSTLRIVGDLAALNGNAAAAIDAPSSTIAAVPACN